MTLPLNSQSGTLFCAYLLEGNLQLTTEYLADICPRWVVNCAESMFAKLIKDDVIEISQRCAITVQNWNVLSTKSWEHILQYWLIGVIDQAIDLTPASAKSGKYWLTVATVSTRAKAVLKARDKNAAYDIINDAYNVYVASAASIYPTYVARTVFTVLCIFVTSAKPCAFNTICVLDAVYITGIDAKLLFKGLLNEIEKELAAVNGEPK